MKIDIVIQPSRDLRADAERIKQAQSWGFDAAWSTEWLSNPFFPLTIAARDTRRFTLGTIAAQAIARSPMISAQISWDLARQTGGSFVLGLDADMPQFLPAAGAEQPCDSSAKIREYLESLRAIWRTFQHDERLRFRGKHYQFRLMAPFFNPGPINNPEIPIFLSGGDSDVYVLAGELCQGLHVNLLHSPSYLRDRVLPQFAQGLANSGRARETFELAVPVLVLSPNVLEAGDVSQKENARNIASYVLPRNNHPFAVYHGWEKLFESLQVAALSSKSGTNWQSFWHRLPADILREIAIVAEPERMAAAIRQRYSGLADRVCLVFAEWDPEHVVAVAADLKKQPLG